jgi:hypothetical protein
MSLTMEEKNAMLRNAVEQRREAQAEGKPLEKWYVDTEETSAEVASQVDWDRLADEPYIEHLLEQQRLRGDDIPAELLPGSLAFLEKIEVIRELHFKKTAEYGDPQDPFANVTASAKCGVEPWRRALCDASDCSVRLQRYANGQPVDFENAIMDNINWLLICWVKHDEAKRG